MKRTEEREIAFKTIYSKFFETVGEQGCFETEDISNLEFASKILAYYSEHVEDINKIISSNLKGYTIERVYKIDLAILIIAIIELEYIKENPKQVIINEAVELAKKYSTDKSPKFINGFLAGLVNN